MECDDDYRLTIYPMDSNWFIVQNGPNGQR